MKKIIGLFTGLLFALISLQPVFAGSSNSTFTTSSVVSNTCYMSISDANLGSLAQTTSSSQKVSATATIQAHCTKNTAYTIALGAGANTISDNRYMIGAKTGTLLQYGICSGPNGTVNPWNCPADANGSTSWTLTTTHSYTGNGSTQSISAYVFAPSGYYVPDTYSDTTTATMTF